MSTQPRKVTGRVEAGGPPSPREMVFGLAQALSALRAMYRTPGAPNQAEKDQLADLERLLLRGQKAAGLL